MNSVIKKIYSSFQHPSVFPHPSVIPVKTGIHVWKNANHHEMPVLLGRTPRVLLQSLRLLHSVSTGKTGLCQFYQNAWEDTTSGLHLFDNYSVAEEAAKELLHNESGEIAD